MGNGTSPLAFLVLTILLKITSQQTVDICSGPTHLRAAGCAPEEEVIECNSEGKYCYIYDALLPFCPQHETFFDSPFGVTRAEGPPTCTTTTTGTFTVTMSYTRTDRQLSVETFATRTRIRGLSNVVGQCALPVESVQPYCFPALHKRLRLVKRGCSLPGQFEETLHCLPQRLQPLVVSQVVPDQEVGECQYTSRTDPWKRPHRATRPPSRERPPLLSNSSQRLV